MVLHRLSELNIKILSYEKQSDDLEDKSTDWFLYDQACTFLSSVHTRKLALITFYSRGKIAWKNVKFMFLLLIKILVQQILWKQGEQIQNPVKHLRQSFSRK